VDQQQQSHWRPTRRQVLWTSGIVAALTVAVLIVLIGYRYGITLWDWVKLLVVPVVIAAGGFWFNAEQRAREQQVANVRAQDEALQAYLDQVTQLLVTQRDDALIRMQVDDDVRQVIQARSEPLLRSLTATRRWSLILFLAVMGLLAKDRPLVSLAGADLRGADGSGAPLEGIDLARANLSGADLRGADLSEADLSEADLSEANLRGANLRGADLSEANLRGAFMDSSIRVSHGRPLMKGPAVNLEYAILRGANLEGATLFDAHLAGADLSDADLREATGLTEEQLTAALSLEGATMPNGQKYEDWFKSKGSGEE
jgi:uncharacterized protein YjbI with pentapeptide repeats